MESSVLDTGVLIAHLRGDARVTRQLREALLQDRVWYVSTLSHYEIYRAAHPWEGHRRAVRPILGDPRDCPDRPMGLCSKQVTAPVRMGSRPPSGATAA